MADFIDDDDSDFENFEDEDEEVVLECETDDDSSEDDDGGEFEVGQLRGRIAIRGAEPYMFEPPARNREQVAEQEPEEDPFAGRREHLDWCSCGHCQVLQHFRDDECKCCMEIEAVKEHAVASNVPCITMIDNFDHGILNPLTLLLAWRTYTEHYRRAARAFNDRTNEKYRYVAYRQLVRLCWGFLGRHVRVTTPACAHALIDLRFPDHNNQYRGTVLNPNAEEELD